MQLHKARHTLEHSRWRPAPATTATTGPASTCTTCCQGNTRRPCASATAGGTAIQPFQDTNVQLAARGRPRPQPSIKNSFADSLLLLAQRICPRLLPPHPDPTATSTQPEPWLAQRTEAAGSPITCTVPPAQVAHHMLLLHPLTAATTSTTRTSNRGHTKPQDKKKTQNKCTPQPTLNQPRGNAVAHPQQQQATYALLGGPHQRARGAALLAS